MKLTTSKITKMDAKDSYGNTSFIIEFASGQKGFFVSKNEDQKNFTVGQETDCVIEEKEGKTGKKYNKITLPQKQFTSGGGGKPQVDPRISMISFSMSYTKDLVVAGKIEMKDLSATFEIIYNEMLSKI